MAASVAAVSKRKRVSFSADVISRAVELSRHVGAVAAVGTMNKTLPADQQLQDGTVRQWLMRYKKDGKFWESAGKRGRPSLLVNVPGAKEEWSRQVESLRAQGSAVTGRVSSTILRAVMEEKTPSLLVGHGGSVKVACKTGQNILDRHGYSYRKKSSSRIIPPTDELGEARDDFYRSLKECCGDLIIDRHLLINFDQTFQQYNPTRGFTWEKRGSHRVQLVDTKDGFTLLPVVSAAGIVAAQLIFSGTTGLSLPTTSPGPYLRYLQTKTHWSNESTTVDLWKNIILPHIAARRLALGDSGAQAIVLADAFDPHWTPKVKSLVEGEDNIAYICVPKSLTHLFQPLDLGIIAAIKASVLRRKDEHMEQEMRTAIRENRPVVLSKSLPVMRNRVTMYIKECLSDPLICAEHCCRVGFERAGVFAAVYGTSEVAPDVDGFVPPVVCSECGEMGSNRLELPACACFENTLPPVPLCDGCHANHSLRCSPVE